MNNLSTDMNNSEEKKEKLSIEWRRARVLEYASKGYNNTEIGKKLQISEPTISRDIEYIRQESQESQEALQEYITKKLPDEVRKTFVSMDLILKKAWNTVESTEDDKTRLSALNLINTVMSSRIDVLGNVDVIDKVIALVSDIKEKQSQKNEKTETKEDITKDVIADPRNWEVIYEDKEVIE